MGHTAHLFMIIGSCSILSDIFKYETLLKQMYYKLSYIPIDITLNNAIKERYFLDINS